MSEVEVREKELFDWRKTVSEVECKLTQQENLLECTVKERNLYSRNLIEAQVQLVQDQSDKQMLEDRFMDLWIFFIFLSILVIVPMSQEEIAEIKRKMKTMNNQVTRLRDEISGKELALAKDEQERKRLDKDNEALKVLPLVLSVAS